MNEYDVKGPFKIEVVKLPGGKKLKTDNFWEAARSSLKKEKGIYVYAIKPSKSKINIPYYVGQAKKTFEQEVFHATKLNKYDDALKNYQKAHPVLFFIVPPKKKGKLNVREINEIEKYLTRECKIINPKIMNKNNAKLPTWQIKGSVHSTKRKSSSEREFDNMISGSW